MRRLSELKTRLFANLGRRSERMLASEETGSSPGKGTAKVDGRPSPLLEMRTLTVVAISKVIEIKSMM